MSWPQYLRRECAFRGSVVRLSRLEADLLAVLLLRGVMPTPVAILADALWADDANGGPENPRTSIGVLIMRLRAKLPGAIGGRLGFGWFIKKEKTMADDLKTKLAALADGLPPTTRCAVVILADDQGHVSVSGLDTSLPQLLQMVGVATSRVGANLKPAPAAPLAA